MDRKVNGSFYFKTLSLHVSMNGLMTSRETIPIDLPKPLDEDLESAILEVAVTSPSNRIDWRIRVNGINIFREFRPFSTIKLSSLFFTKHVYDITWLLKTPESIGRRCINITFRREGGDPFVVKQISLGLIYGNKDSYSEIEYYTGGLALDPGEKTIIKASSREDSFLNASIYMPSKQAIVKVRSHDMEETISNTLDIFNYVKKVDKPTQQLEFEHVNPRETYSPKSIVISNLVIYRTITPRPRIVFKKVEYSDKTLTLVISNEGESKPDYLLVTIISRGNTLLTKKLPLIKPGEQHEERLTLSLPPGENDLVIRAVWRKICSLDQSEHRLKVIST